MRANGLDPLFRPRSIVLIGADRQPFSLGAVVARNLFSGHFEGPVLPVHVSLPAVRGVLAFRTIADLPLVPDLAVIASEAAEVAAILSELGARGTRVAIVLNAGFETPDPSSPDSLTAAASAAGVRIVGPACLGVMVPATGLNATYAHAEPKKGDVALVTQSTSLVSILLDSTAGRDAGFSLVASLGDMVDIDFGDVLDYLALDSSTRSVLLAVDHIDDARRFLSAARMLARIKPVIVFDAGRCGEDADATDATTVPRDRVYEAAFRRAGMLPVPFLTDLVAAAGTLAAGTRVSGDRLAIVCNGGSIGRVTMQMWEATGGRAATLSEATRTALDALLPKGWQRRNPVNVFADAGVDRYRGTLASLFADDTTDIVFLIVCPTAVGDAMAAATAVRETLAQKPRHKQLAVVWLDEATRAEAAARLADMPVAVHPSVRWAVTAFAQLLAYQRNQEMLIETPASLPDLFSCDVRRAEKVIAGVLARGETWLHDADAAALLAAYDLPVLPAQPADNVEEAVAVAETLGYPVALRLRTDGSVDESTVGGIALDLEDADAVRAAAHRIERRVREIRPELPSIAFAVAALAGKGDAHVLRLGLAADPDFGPVIHFGQGGNSGGSLLDDNAFGLPPLNLALARTLMAETRVWAELHGSGHLPPAPVDEVALAVVRLSQIATDLPQVQEVDINPLLADSDGVAALSVRIRVAAIGATSATRLAIRPYPVELEKTITTRSGKHLLLRPIRPEDEPALQAFVRQMSPEDIRMRFFSPLKELDHRFAARLTQIDYDREMALVAIDPEAEGTSIWGVMRISADTSGTTAEYAGSVRSDLKGQGLGRLLMEEILDCAGRRGIAEVWGEVLAENQGMLTLARKLGFTLNRDPDDPSVIHVVKSLATG